ncbi:MAG: Uma2 family endonuclease [Planctomycetaceae bacterium]
MRSLILDPILEAQFLAERKATGADRYDEVWDGIYNAVPKVDDEHQALVTGLSSTLCQSVSWTALGDVRAGTNVTNRTDNWTQNYRCPDVAVFLRNTRAENRDTHWLGGPDLAVEVISRHDRSREKLDFYAKVGTRELLIVDRYPWALELYRLGAGKLELVAVSTPGDPKVLVSQVVPLSWQIVPGKDRPGIAVTHADGKQQWTI